MTLLELHYILQELCVRQENWERGNRGPELLTWLNF